MQLNYFKAFIKKKKIMWLTEYTSLNTRKGVPPMLALFASNGCWQPVKHYHLGFNLSAKSIKVYSQKLFYIFLSKEGNRNHSVKKNCITGEKLALWSNKLAFMMMFYYIFELSKRTKLFHQYKFNWKKRYHLWINPPSKIDLSKCLHIF